MDKRLDPWKNPIDRAISIDIASLNPEERSFEISFSSETPVLRWGQIYEILDHAPESVNLNRINNRGAVLWNHERNAHLGVVLRAWVDTKTRKGRAKIQMSRSPLGDEKLQDIKDGVLTHVSCRYETDIRSVKLTGQIDGIDALRFFAWTPLEISFTPVAEDDSVGVGRSIEPQPPTQDPMILKRSLNLDHEPADGGNNNPADPASQPARPTPAFTEQQRAKIETDAATRVAGIMNLASEYKIPAETTQRFVTERRSIDEFANYILKNHLKAKEIHLDPAIGMSPHEVKQWSLVRAIRTIANKGHLDGLEKEASDAAAKRIGRSPEGFFIPHDVMSRSLQDSHQLSPGQAAQILSAVGQLAGGGQRALNTSVATAGGYTVGVNVLGNEMIELLRNMALVTQLGARQLSGLVGDIAIPRAAGGATAFWLSETGTLTPSDQSFGQLGLIPHRLGGATAYTKQLISQSSIDVEAFVRQDLLAVLAVEKDRACITGNGAAGEPIGIMNTTGIGAVTFGAAATRAKALEFQTDVAGANALMGNLAYVTTPATAGTWLSKDQATNVGNWLWQGSVLSGTVVGLTARSTKQVPGDKVIFGNWSDFVVADWDGMDVVVDPYSLSLLGQVRVVIHLLTDCGIRHVGSFSVSTDSGAQ
jgi:HK97 family phage major capsid protein